MDAIYSIALLSILATLSPYLGRLLLLPLAVLEIMLGAIAHYLGWLQSSEAVAILAKIGFLYLMFLAGLEINIKAFGKAGRLILKRALLYFIVLYLSSFLLCQIFNLSPLYYVAIPIVSLGMIMALLDELGSEHRWLELALTIGVLGELISIAAMIVLDGILIHGLGMKFYLTLGTLVLVLMSIALFFYFLRIAFWWFPELRNLLMPTSGQKNQDIRLGITLFFIMVAIMYSIGLDLVLGAFIAGLFISMFMGHNKELPHKLSSFGFSFLVPVFFIHVGATLDLETMNSMEVIWHAIFIMGMMLFVRLLSSFVAYYALLGGRNTILFALGDSMPLTFLVAIATLGLHSKAISPQEYNALILAAMIEGTLIMTLVKILSLRWKLSSKTYPSGAQPKNSLRF